jgi:hypothetical protein
MAVLFLLHWPTWPVAGHLAVLGLVGVIVVELLFAWLPQISFRLFLPAWSIEGSCGFLGLVSGAGAVERGSNGEGTVEPANQLLMHGCAARSDCGCRSMAYGRFREVGGRVGVRGGVSS